MAAILVTPACSVCLVCDGCYGKRSIGRPLPSAGGKQGRSAGLALQGRVAGLAHRCAAALLHGVGRKGVAANVRDKTAVAVEVEVAAMALPTADAVGLGLGLRYRPQEATGGHGRPQGCSETPVLIAAGASWTCAGGCFHSNLVGAAVQGCAGRGQGATLPHARYSSTLPCTQVTVSPPIQNWSPSCATCTRPARPSTVPWLAV